MTKTVRIENADGSDYKLTVESWDSGQNGAPDRLVQVAPLDYPTAMVSLTLWKERYLVIRETDSEATVLSVDPNTAPDGWYWLTSADEPQASIVRLYTNPDIALRGLGFNISDGGSFLPLSDLRSDSVLRPVK